MHRFVRQHWSYLLTAIALHALFAGSFAASMLSMARRPAPVQLAIQAVLVDRTVLERTAEQRQRRAPVPAEAPRRRQQAEAARLQQEQGEARRAEREQLERRQQEQEAQRRQAQEAERQAQEARRQAEEIERRQEAEALQRRKAAEEARAQAAREAELHQQLQEEEGRMQAMSSGALQLYVAQIEQRIVRNWHRPPSARPGLRCVVHVTQAPGGTVLLVRIGQCNGDAAVRQSIETAVMRSSPLPAPPDARLFERNLELIFKPLD